MSEPIKKTKGLVNLHYFSLITLQALHEGDIIRITKCTP